MAMDDHRCRVRMTLQFESAEVARNVARALEPDNKGFLKSTVKGRRIYAEAEAGSIPAILHTLDDYLACLAVASRLRIDAESNEE